MAIQKHLVTYAQQRAPDKEPITISVLMQLIEYLEKHDFAMNTSSAVPVLTLLINSMAQIQLPRDAHEITLIKYDILRITSLFKNLQISNENRLHFLENVYYHVISPTPEPQPLLAFGFLVIPDEMITQAIEHFFKILQWNGKKIRESIVIAMRRLIHWQRSQNFNVPLDLWIGRTLSLLNTNGFNEIIDEIAIQNILPAFISLCIPIFQTKMLSVFQVLLENARNTKELFDKIVPQCTQLLRSLEKTESEIYEPLMELICETLTTINQTDFQYKDLVKN